jgi:PiT family inorganic phosphate transporter
VDPLTLLVIVVLVALAFDVTNGFHDTANSVAPMLAARAAGPRVAVVIVALSNGAGALMASGAVAATIGTGIIDPAIIDLQLVLAALCGAIVWNVATWRFAIPCSSSLALVGGLAGAGIAAGGISSVTWTTVADKAFVPALLAPIVGASIAMSIWLLLVRVLRKRPRRPVERGLRRLQIGSAALQSFAHGTNDAQKTMGVIALALLAGNPSDEFSVPLWVVLACSASLTIGTLAGGWRIIATMSRGIARIDLAQGVAATTAGGIVLLLASRFGMPVSTTYAAVGSIIGAGATKGLHRVRWQAGQDILIAWAITIPCTAAVALVCSVVAHAAPLLLAAGVLALLVWMLRQNARDAGPAPAPASAAAPA